MRMWMVPAELLCTKHLVGEHGEIHKHQHKFIKKHKISGRIYPIVQVEPEAMKSRHDELAMHLKNHKSPYEQPDLSHLPGDQRYAKADYWYNLFDLCCRCPDCRGKILNYLKEK